MPVDYDKLFARPILPPDPAPAPRTPTQHNALWWSLIFGAIAISLLIGLLSDPSLIIDPPCE